jgi:hypothetical protein
MAATYIPVPRSVPSSQRTTAITSVAVDDQIDLVDVLGRPARGVQFVLTDGADTITYRLNNLLRIPTDSSYVTEAHPTDAMRAFKRDTTEVWSQSSDFPQFTGEGSTIEIVEGLRVSSIQIDALTLSVGTTITIIVW